jgi:uncharacterized membrane protein
MLRGSFCAAEMNRMHSLNIVLGLENVITGVILIAVALPLIHRQIPPNRWYGVRIRAAFRSEEAWYRINQHGGKSFRAMGVAIIMAGGLVWALLPRDPQPGLIFAVAMLPAILLVPTMVHVYRYPRSGDGA